MPAVGCAPKQNGRWVCRIIDSARKLYIRFECNLVGILLEVAVTVVCKLEAIEKSIPSLNVGDRFPTYLKNVIYCIKYQTANIVYMPQTSLIAMLSKRYKEL